MDDQILECYEEGEGKVANKIYRNNVKKQIISKLKVFLVLTLFKNL